MGRFQYFGHLYRVFNQYLINFERGRLTRARLIMKMIMLVADFGSRPPWLRPEFGLSKLRVGVRTPTGLKRLK